MSDKAVKPKKQRVVVNPKIQKAFNQIEKDIKSGKLDSKEVKVKMIDLPKGDGLTDAQRKEFKRQRKELNK